MKLSYRGRENRISSLVVTLFLVFLVVIVIVVMSVFVKDNKTEFVEEYQWITSDSAAQNGMLDGTFYSGEKNSAAMLSYKIAEVINVDSEGIGDFKIENSGKNVSLIKVKMYVDGKIIYETGYIKPNQHINNDQLDEVPEKGVYTADVVFEGFDPNTEQSIGSTNTQISLTVN